MTTGQELLSALTESVGRSKAGNRIVLRANINLYGIQWPTWGEPFYNLVFDGGGFEIFGLNVQNAQQCSLFGNLVGCEVSNVRLKQFRLSASEYVAAVCVRAQDSEINNVALTNSQMSGKIAGGIIAIAERVRANAILISSDTTVRAEYLGGGFCGLLLGGSIVRNVQTDVVLTPLLPTAWIGGIAGTVAALTGDITIRNISSAASVPTGYRRGDPIFPRKLSRGG